MNWLSKDVQMTLSKQLQVFLLYARNDKEAVHRLYKRLVKDGARVWLDERSILPGQDWAYEIRKTIQRSDIVVVCLSKQFNKQGGYRHEELKIAVEKANTLAEDEIFLIPARLEICELPEPLRCWQRVDLFDASGYKKLMRALKEHIVSA
ncbi:MAG TPA: toll/interleukin-1 receptor domain-containing protein [Anaerolineales bacterium]|nr:toll/interleukin-1 receptor domain-containing protein [Anaerolineales bacterium]